MGKRSRKTRKSRSELQGYVVVTFAEDLDLAAEYESLLQANDIPVVVKEQRDHIGNLEIAVMVPEEFLDEAHVIIESQDAYDEFYDFAMDGDEEDDFGEDILEDEF